MSKKTKNAAAPATTTPTPTKTVRSAEGERLRKRALAEIQARVEGKPYEGTAYRPDGKKVKVTVPRDGAKRGKAKPAKAPKNAKPPRLSALDAAAQVLAGSDKPMRAQDLIEQMAAKGLWKSPGGKTPAATLYAAVLREIQAKKSEARFKKVERGLFVSTGKKGA